MTTLHAQKNLPEGLRLAEKSDFDQVFDLYMDENVLPQISFRKTDKPGFLPIFERLITSPGLWVYEQDNRIVAAYRLTRLEHRIDHVVHIGSLGVLSSFQRKGIGRKLMAFELERLRSEGIRRVQLFVLKNNEKGVRFYQSLGFEIEGELRAYCQAVDSNELLPELAMSIIF